MFPFFFLAFLSYCVAISPGDIQMLFGDVCSENTLPLSVFHCGLTSNGSVAVWYVPDYIYASRTMNRYNPNAPNHKLQCDFVLFQNIRLNSNLDLPTMGLSIPRKFVNHNVQMDLNYVLSSSPNWKNQIEYIQYFCGIEGKYCAFTVQNILDYASSKLGKSVSMTKAVSTYPTHEKTMVIHNMTNVIRGANAVACHDVYFLFSMMACHSLRNFTLIQIDAGGSLGLRYMSCHGDTSIWAPDHPAFRLLKIPYGTPDICHQENERAIFFY